MALAARDPILYSRQDHDDLVDRGNLTEGDRVELREGVIVTMFPQNPPDAWSITHATLDLVQAAGKRALARVQLPAGAPDLSVSEPDLACA
ncbi:MAG: hypothetical protein U0166_09890 [Acidobacteriota bacterium]